MWDERGLLHVHAYDIPTYYPEEQVRIFGAMKDSMRDRQIGDRRGRNFAEARVEGPSKHLPNASDVCDLHVCLKQEGVSLSITDRRDFYHQIWVSEARAITNTLGPGVDPALLQGTEGLNLFLLAEAKKKKRRDRLVDGDELGFHCLRAPLSDQQVFISFRSVFQGDHSGVDIACDAHAQLLRNGGLLPQDQLLSGTSPWIHPKRMQGLCIDDFFSLDITKKGERSAAEDDFEKAQRIYAREGLKGSADKDIRGAASGRIIGAFVDGSKKTTDVGLVTVASPREKRYAMSWITLQLCQLDCATDALHLSLLGGWTSMAMFRRPFMGLFHEVYHLVDVKRYDPNNPKLVKLPKSTAEELVMAAVLVPLFQTDATAGFGDFLYATDASEKKGAICRAPMRRDLQEVLFRACKSKGAYTRLQRPSERILFGLGRV